MKYFETIKCDDYEIFNLAYHEKRISSTIGINFSLGEYIYPPSNKLLRCKLVYDENSIIDLQFFSYKKRDIKSFKLIFDDSIDYSKKYLNRNRLDELFEKRKNCDEIIIIKNGFVSDTSIANIAIFDGSNWLTPRKALLNGTTRKRLLDKNIIIEKDINVKMLKNAKKLALMNAMIDFDILEEFSFN